MDQSGEQENTEKKEISISHVLQTKDYSIFKKLPGNRSHDKHHVNKLKKNMLNVGNLTNEFPIVVNERYEVVDGQHRLEALKELKWPVGYRVQAGLTLDTVRGINQAGQNWSWKDYAESFIGSGTPEQKDQYTRFMNIYNQFGVGYRTVGYYIDLGVRTRSEGALFVQGELQIKNQERSYKLLKKYKEVSEALEHENGIFAVAFYKVMQAPQYDHDRMLHKARLWDVGIKKMGTVEDYQRLLETIYNKHMPESAQVRLY